MGGGNGLDSNFKKTSKKLFFFNGYVGIGIIGGAVWDSNSKGFTPQ